MNDLFDIVPQRTITSTAVLSFAALWRSKAGPQGLPQRGDFAMQELLPFLGNILIMDVIDGGADFSYRLIGTAIVAASNRDVTGQKVSDLAFEVGTDVVLNVYQQMLAHQEGSFWAGQVAWAKNKMWKPFEAFAAPLAKDGSMPGQIIAYFDFPPVGDEP